MLPTTDRPSDPRIYRVTGDATIATLPDVRDELLRVVAKSAHIVIDVSEVEQSDISFLQLLASTRRTCIDLGRRLEVHGIDSSRSVRELVDIAGFSSWLEDLPAGPEDRAASDDRLDARGIDSIEDSV